MKAYYLGNINTPNGTLVRNREYDAMAERTLQLAEGDDDARFAFFNGDISTILIVETRDRRSGYMDNRLVVAEIRSKEDCLPITWEDISAMRQQIFDTDADVIVEAPVDPSSSGNVAFMRQTR